MSDKGNNSRKHVPGWHTRSGGFIGDQNPRLLLPLSDRLDAPPNPRPIGEQRYNTLRQLQRKNRRVSPMPKGISPGINPSRTVFPHSPPSPVEVTPDWQYPNPLRPRVAGNAPGLPALDPKSERRARMFRKARKSQDARLPMWTETNNPELDSPRTHGVERGIDALREAEQMHTDSRSIRMKRLIAAGRRSDNARSMQSEFRSTEFDPDRGKNTIPYRPAVGAKSRPTTPPSPSSGVAPRIAGTAASAILKGTGALGALPAIIHLARGGSVGSLAGPLPSKFVRGPRIRGM